MCVSIYGQWFACTGTRLLIRISVDDGSDWTLQDDQHLWKETSDRSGESPHAWAALNLRSTAQVYHWQCKFCFSVRHEARIPSWAEHQKAHLRLCPNMLSVFTKSHACTSLLASVLCTHACIRCVPASVHVRWSTSTCYFAELLDISGSTLGNLPAGKCRSRFPHCGGAQRSSDATSMCLYRLHWESASF